MTNAIKNAQYYLNALRAQDYFTAKDFVLYVQTKYTAIAEQSLGQDDILPLVIYELCQTDINKQDVNLICFIAEYLSANGLDRGHVGYAYMTLIQAFPFAVEIKQADSFKTINGAVVMEDFKDIKEFVSEKSPYSQLSSVISQSQDENLIGEMATYLHEMDVSKYIEQMDTKTLQAFTESMQTIYKKSGVPYNCPFINANKTLLINYVNEYKNLLMSKLEGHGVYFTEATSDWYCLKGDAEDLPKKVTDLLHRLQIIENLEIETIDISDGAQIKKVHDTVMSCKSFRPDWIERDLLEKITDILSLGIKPLIRALTSKQTKVENEIEETITTISKFSMGNG